MNHKADFCKAINSISRKHEAHQVFIDFCEMSAISLRQPFERSEELEATYMDIVGKYDQNETKVFSELFAIVMMALEANPRDFLGECFHELELHNKWRGQFFTPYNLSLCMAEMSLENVADLIDKHGYISLNEPACGSGGMVIAAAEVMKKQNLDPVRHLWTVSQDIDRKCCCMTYIQLSLLAIPGAVVWGNTLMVECREQWLTSGTYLGDWKTRFKWKDIMSKIKSTMAAIPQAITPVTPENTITIGQLEFNF